jgi:pimeloyl-ACP methyl ester carboxylesterase
MQLYYREFGQGEPVVILHGLLGFSDNWQTLAKALAQTHRVITPDLRNHGRSPHATTHTYPEMAQDLTALLDHLSLDAATLVGHSMGGKVAMQLALNQPERVARLVVVDIAPGAAPGHHEIVFQALLSLDIRHLHTREEADKHLAQYLLEPAVRQFLLKNLTRNPDGAFTWKMNLPVLWRHYRDILAPVDGRPFNGPALFVRGSLSNYISEEDFPLIRELFPQARIETVADAGHWVHADKPQELLALLQDFLA